MSKHSEGQEDLRVSFVSFLWTLMPRQGLPSQTGCKERRQTWSWLGQAIDWLMRRQNTLEVRDWGRKKSSLILAGCWGKAGGGRQAVFVTLLILGQQEKLHWHHPHTTGEGKMAIWPSYLGQNLQSFCLVFCDRFLDCTFRPNLIQVPGKKRLFADFWKWSNPTRRDWENPPSCSKGEASLGCQ